MLLVLSFVISIKGSCLIALVDFAEAQVELLVKLWLMRFGLYEHFLMRFTGENYVF